MRIKEQPHCPPFFLKWFPKTLEWRRKPVNNLGRAKASKHKSPRRTVSRRLQRSYLRAGGCQVRRRTRDETRWSSYSAQGRRGCCVIARTRRCAAQERRKSRRDAPITGRDQVLHKSSLALPPRKYYAFIANANVVVFMTKMTSWWPFALSRTHIPTEVFSAFLS